MNYIAQAEESIPNIAKIPKSCSHLWKEDDVLYLVPGTDAAALIVPQPYYFEINYIDPR